MFTRAVRIARVRGVEVRLDPSLALIVVLVGWTLGTRFAADHALSTAIPMAAAGTLLFFGSLLAHEFAHALEALHRDLEVHSITLFLFGGVTEMHATTNSPRDEFVIAAVGPYVSLVCGAAFGLVATFATALPAAIGIPVAEVAGLLGWLNVLLAVFNLVPGAPLDGGRVLRAGLWWITGDRRRGLRIAARAGQALGLGLAGYGLTGLVMSGTAVAFAAFWWVLIGGFLYAAARTELRQSDLDDLLLRHRVADLFPAPPRVLDAGQRLDAADLPSPDGDLVTVVSGTRLLGVIPAEHLATLHPTERALRIAGELAQPVDDRPVVSVDATIRTLVDGFHHGSDAVRIVAGQQPVAVLTERDVARGIQRLRRTPSSARNRPPLPPPPASASPVPGYGPPPPPPGGRP